MISTLLEKAFNEASKLSMDKQDIFASFILEELNSEKKWDKLFSISNNILEKLSNNSIKEFEEGKTTELDINSL